MVNFYGGILLSVIALILLLMEMLCVIGASLSFATIKSQIDNAVCQLTFGVLFCSCLGGHLFILELFMGKGYISRLVGL